ncbi:MULTISPECIES: TauD/TfdA family dioxygenase [Streptomyces]|uniref:TauD/TfdA family dioxygenase n=1 Tax=Streptomyces lonegramiae TaxID=3075524 RepID=A0ABU2XAX2_9ACTN|nr:TauD/TfdA family dioxygenase [Streptomyces sp. DSM 41529]MDT0542621.1 TauD/TfdA family dioxygenase [Streptomyces sp. DSM 41529]
MNAAENTGADLRSAPTFIDLVIPERVKESLGEQLAGLGDPAQDMDRAMALCHQIFATLPIDLLQSILDFGRHADTPGVARVGNLPVEHGLPDTPDDGGPCRTKSTYLSEGVLLGLSGMLGEPVEFTTEKNGQLIHDVIPVADGATTQTNRSSTVFLNFHNDIVYDEAGSYNASNPDFLVLNCLRADHEGVAGTYYADARDVCQALDASSLKLLTEPLFRLNAPGGYARLVGKSETLSAPAPIISGPEWCPEIASSANGVHALSPEAEAALRRLQSACREVAHEVFLRPGQALLINNRKGLHARSEFEPRYDGRDRWLQRTYIRRNHWSIRDRVVSRTRRLLRHGGQGGRRADSGWVAPVCGRDHRRN